MLRRFLVSAVQYMQPELEPVAHSIHHQVRAAIPEKVCGALGQLRYYKSKKSSMKPINTRASWLAVKPFLPPVPPEVLEERQRFQRAPIVETCIPPLPVVQYPPFWTRYGKIVGPYELELQQSFAVVEIQGAQHKVTADDIVFVNWLHGPNVNDVISLDRVMLLGSRYQTIVGRPYVPGASVLAAVEEHFRDGKIHVFKYKKRKDNRKYLGHRSNYTTLRILQVKGIAEKPGTTLPELNIPMVLNTHTNPTGRQAQLFGAPEPPVSSQQPS